MIFNKYNSFVTKNGISGSFASQKSSSSSNTNNSSSGGVDLNRLLWGNPDYGNDIDSHLVCGGNIFVGSADFSDENDDEEEDRTGEDSNENDDLDYDNQLYYKYRNIFNDDEGGNLYVEKRLITDKTVETKEAIADKHIVRGGTKNQIMLADGSVCNKGKITIDYIDLVDVEGTIGLQGDEGVSVVLQDYPTAPKFKFSAIPATTESLGGVKIGSGLSVTKDGILSADLDDIWERITKVEGDITTINNKIKNFLTEDEIKALIEANTPKVDINTYGSVTQPVCLFAGVIKRTNKQTPIVWSWSGAKLDCIDDNLTITVDKGDLTFNLRPNELASNITVCAANATQYISGDLEDIEETSHSGSNSGAHWFEVRPLPNGNGYKVHVREIHKTNSNNESWATNDWNENQGSIYGVNVVVMGYATPTSTSGSGSTGGGSSSGGDGLVDISSIIVQETGQSQTKVMSQKAVTDELGKIPTVVQTTGTSTKNVMSQKAVGDAIDNAFKTYTFGTTVSNIPTNYRYVFIDLTMGGVFSLNNTLEAGQEIHIIVTNKAAAEISVAIPPSVFKTNKTVLQIPSGSFGEINVICVQTGELFVRCAV